MLVVLACWRRLPFSIRDFLNALFLSAATTSGNDKSSSSSSTEWHRACHFLSLYIVLYTRTTPYIVPRPPWLVSIRAVRLVLRDGFWPTCLSDWAQGHREADATTGHGPWAGERRGEQSAGRPRFTFCPIHSIKVLHNPPEYRPLPTGLEPTTRQSELYGAPARLTLPLCSSLDCSHHVATFGVFI